MQNNQYFVIATKYAIVNNNAASIKNRKLLFYLSVCIGAFMLFIPAIFNGYPIVNPDDGTYLWSGFCPATPVDRPIGYGLTLWLTSFGGISLFLSAFCQCWLMSWLITKCFQRIFPNANYLVLAPAAILVLAFCSSASWICSELLPDFYTSVGLLCLVLLLLQKENKLNNVLLFFIYTVAMSTHMSHVAIFIVVIAGTLLFRKKLFSEQQVKNAALRLFAALTLTLGSLFTMGYAMGCSSHVFAMAALLEQGVLKEYLDDKCPTEHYKICDYKEQLAQNRDPNVFLWLPESPLHLTGGWEANKEEYSQIIRGTLSSPKYILLRAKMSLKYTGKQAMEFGIGDGNAPLFTFKKELTDYTPSDTTAYLNAKQQKGQLLPIVKLPNTVFKVIVIASLLLLGLVIAFSKKKTQPFILFAFLALLFVLANLWVCATFGQVNGRYGCRVMWLIPLCAIIGVIQWRLPRGNRI